MELQHTFTVPIGIDEAWAAFTDIERIAPCLPGAVITSVDGDDFEGTAKVKLGPIALQYAGKGTWVSRDASTYSAVIEAQGKDKRGNGTAGATIKAHLEPEGAGTKVVVDTELKITGRPAQFGRGVIQDVGGKLLDQFAPCLSTRLAEPAEPVPNRTRPSPVADTPSDVTGERRGLRAAGRGRRPAAARDPTRPAPPAPPRRPAHRRAGRGQPRQRRRPGAAQALRRLARRPRGRRPHRLAGHAGRALEALPAGRLAARSRPAVSTDRAQLRRAAGSGSAWTTASPVTARVRTT